MSVSGLSPGTSVGVGATLFFSAVGSNFSPTSFSVGDSASASTIASNAINSSGQFHWTPLVQDVGSHTLTINASDSFGHIHFLRLVEADETKLLPGEIKIPLLHRKEQETRSATDS